MTPTIEDRAHALLAPSSAYAMIECKASTAAQIGQPDNENEDAASGTATHELSAWCLTSGNDAEAYLGRVIVVSQWEFEVDEDRAARAQMYVGGIRARIAAYELTGATVQMFVEQRLSIEHITGEKGAKGTADCVLIVTWPDGRALIDVSDLKDGHREVSAVKNYQGMFYASAALEEHGAFVDFDTVKINIYQPRLSEHPSEWELSADELREWINTVAKPAAETAMLYVEGLDTFPLTLRDFNPGEKQCQYCKAKAVCPALAKFVEDTIGADFDEIVDAPPVDRVGDATLLDNDKLGQIYPALPLIESWGKAVLARIEHELLAGNAVPGTKLVQGRRGHRKWNDADEAEALLKSMRLKQEQMYNFKLISPTQTEKLLAKESPRRWKKAEAMVVQPNGSPSVAPDSDKRAALVIAPIVDDFEVVDTGDDLL